MSSHRSAARAARSARSVILWRSQGHANVAETTYRRSVPKWPWTALLVLLSSTAWALRLSAADDGQTKGQPHDGATEDASPEEPMLPDRFEIRSSDGSALRVRLLEEKIPLKTEFGTLQIPIGDIRRIDFATRVPPDVSERVMTVIGKLGDNEYQTREAATAELLSLGAAAYPALLMTAESDDPEVVRRSELLLEQIRKTVNEEFLEQRGEDKVSTEKSQIAGTIDLESLRIDTALFGEQAVKLVHLRRLSFGTDVEQEPGTVLTDPGTLNEFQNRIGQTIFFRVTGPAPGVQPGAVWGSGIYTFDSNLSLAAVHAGAVAPGQTKVVGVTMLGPQNAFAGSTQNGITTGNWGQYPAAFTFKTAKNAMAPPARGVRLRAR